MRKWVTFVHFSFRQALVCFFRIIAFFVSTVCVASVIVYLHLQVNISSCFCVHIFFCLSIMAPREQVKSDVFESRVNEKDLDWFRRRFHIPADYTLRVTDKKAHEPYTGFEKLVVYKD